MATPAQRKWCARFGLPQCEADKICCEKAFQYEKWKNEHWRELSVEEFLDKRMMYQWSEIQREYMYAR